MSTKQILSQKVKSLRKEQNFSQDQLADMAQVSRKTIADIENEKCNRMPSIENLIKISEALGVTPDLLLGFSDKENKNLESNIKSYLGLEEDAILYLRSLKTTGLKDFQKKLDLYNSLLKSEKDLFNSIVSLLNDMDVIELRLKKYESNKDPQILKEIKRLIYKCFYTHSVISASFNLFVEYNRLDELIAKVSGLGIKL